MRAILCKEWGDPSTLTFEEVGSPAAGEVILGTANLVFWSSFLQLDVFMIGVVTTALHIIFVGAQAACLWRGSRAIRPG
jgi:hypothetical protein